MRFSTKVQTENRPFLRNRGRQVLAFPDSEGAALITTLALLVFVTILAMGVLSIARLERISARNAFATSKARLLSEMAADHALTLIRDSISAAESTAAEPDAAKRKFWASQPGKITVFNADGSIDTTASRALYPVNTDLAAPKVDLNAAPFGGKHPIMLDDGTGSAPVMEVPWIEVLADPTAPASATNRLVGRYAFWVDDESTKLNINTADGSAKGSDVSFGAGSPAEVDLQVLATSSGTLPEAEAESIAKQSGARYDAAILGRPFNSIREILQTDSLLPEVFDLNFQDLTTYSRSPDLNIFGEPKIHLTTAIPATGAIPNRTFRDKETGTPLSLLSGSYAAINPHPTERPPLKQFYSKNVATGQPLTWIYPSSGTSPANSQIPAYQYRSYGDSKDTTVQLPQFFRDDVLPYVSAIANPQDHPAKGFPEGSLDYEMGMRIARYLKGWNSQGDPLQWPTTAIEGAGTGGFAAKYTDRQLDDMTVQILSQLKQTHIDHYFNYTLPYYIPTGFLSGKPVRGASRGPRLTEVVMKVTALAGDPPEIKIQIVTELYLPKQFGGSDLTFWDLNGWYLRINWKDWPSYDTASATEIKPSPMGGYWADSLLRIKDQNGQSVGVDFFGNSGNEPDPNPDAGSYHHPWALKDPNQEYHPTDNPYMGTGNAPKDPQTGEPLKSFGNPVFIVNQTLPGNAETVKAWMRGDYLAMPNVHANRGYKMKSETTSITIEGGLDFWLVEPSKRPVEAAPIDSLFPYFHKLTAPLTPAQRETFQQTVIPIPGTKAERTMEIPSIKVFHMQVPDPMVNSFPGDWHGSVLADTSSPKITIPTAAFSGPVFYQNGLNTISKVSEGGDPESIWWPEQNVSIPKSRRFPSSGYLQYIRTGVMPDPENDSKPIPEQKGTPWRTLNFAPSTAASQQTLGGGSFPDWLMLEFFTSPAIFQPLGDPLPTPIAQTWGGATAGRINPNGVLLPFNLTRTKPLEGLFKDVQVTMSYDGAGDPVKTDVDEVALASAVTTYIQSLGRPLMLPGEICNVPAVAAHVYDGVDEKNRSRNDLVRQTIGNLTTRSNTFKAWAVGEAIQKKNGNTDYGTYQSGDVTVGRSRMCYLIERYLDPGTDEVYGNSVDPGLDGVVNTPDDPTTGIGGAHPTMTYPLPYKYRVISVSQVE